MHGYLTCGLSAANFLCLMFIISCLFKYTLWFAAFLFRFLCDSNTCHKSAGSGLGSESGSENTHKKIKMMDDFSQPVASQLT